MTYREGNGPICIDCKYCPNEGRRCAKGIIIDPRPIGCEFYETAPLSKADIDALMTDPTVIEDTADLILEELLDE